MVDLEGKEKGNISLPARLQPPDEEDDEPKVMIVNMQKASYEVKIADLERRIKRLEDRNKYILDETAAENLKITLKDTETANEIAEINLEISKQTGKREADNEEIQKLEQLRLLDQEENEKKMNLFQEKYEKTRLTLVSEIKTLNAKINTLEDFKTTKEVLCEKLEQRNEMIRKNEEKLRWLLEQIDRKFKIEKERIKNELHKQLLNLASNFQIEITEDMPPPVHRLIRENITIQNELIHFFNDSISKQENCNDMQSTIEIYKKQIKENRQCIFHQIVTNKIQASLLNDLKVSHLKVKKRLADSKQFSQYAKKDHKIFLEELNEEEEQLDFQRRQLEVVLHQSQVKVYTALNKKNQSKHKIRKQRQILYNLKFAVCSALKISGIDEEIQKMTDNELLLHLLNIITNQSETRITPIKSIKTTFPVDDIYQIGDLGFNPNLESQIISMKDTEPSFRGKLEFIKQSDEESLTTVSRSSQTNFEENPTVMQSEKLLRSIDESLKSIFDKDEENRETDSIEEKKNEISSEDEMELKDIKENDV